MTTFRPASLLAQATLAWLLLGGAGRGAWAGEPTGMTATTEAKSRAEPPAGLREFGRFLDHHPLLEDRLRLDPTLLATPAFVQQHTELRTFLAANPEVPEYLKTRSFYFLDRALLRQAVAPVAATELAPLAQLLQREPALQHELMASPQSIRNPLFLEANPQLRECLVAHPKLASVFLPSTTQNP